MVVPAATRRGSSVCPDQVECARRLGPQDRVGGQVLLRPFTKLIANSQGGALVEPSWEFRRPQVAWSSVIGAPSDWTSRGPLPLHTPAHSMGGVSLPIHRLCFGNLDEAVGQSAEFSGAPVSMRVPIRERWRAPRAPIRPRASPFHEATVLVMDGYGDVSATSAYI